MLRVQNIVHQSSAPGSVRRQFNFGLSVHISPRTTMLLLSTTISPTCPLFFPWLHAVGVYTLARLRCEHVLTLRGMMNSCLRLSRVLVVSLISAVLYSHVMSGTLCASASRSPLSLCVSKQNACALNGGSYIYAINTALAKSHSDSIVQRLHSRIVAKTSMRYYSMHSLAT